MSRMLHGTAPWSRGETLAVVWEDERWSYDAWRVMVEARAHRLTRQGLRPGQLVLCQDRPALDVLLMQHALARLRAILLPLRETIDAAELEQLARSCGAEWRWSAQDAELCPTGWARDPRRPTDPRLALFIRTSGSSGAPKVVMLRAEALHASARASNERLSLTEGDRYLGCLRLSHVGGAAIAYRCALAGATYVLQQGFETEQVHRALHAEAITHLSLVPPMLARLLDQDPTPPPALRAVLVGGQALSPALARRALEAGWPLHLTYGMSETGSQIVTSERLERLPEEGRVGLPLPGVELDVPECDAPAARLRVRGSLVMAGYANAARAPGDGLEDGWFLSADLGCREAGGVLRVLGRADDVCVIGGQNISLAGVEARLSEAPGVRELAVVALPDAVWGWRLTACYSGDIEPEALERWARAEVSGACCPRAFRRLTSLPLLHSGKYDRQVLRDLASD